MLKQLIETVLVESGIPRLARARLGGQALVLAYHNVVPERETARGDLSLHLPRRAFAAQLDTLLRTHDVVSLEEAVRSDPHARRPRIAITFDDAYRGAVLCGVEELSRRGLPATIFVAPAFTGGGTFWWDALAGEHGLDESLRAEALGTLQGKDHLVRARAAERGLMEHPLPWYQTAADESELADAIRVPGIRLGSHTWSHPNLAALGNAELHEELRRPLVWLQQRFPGALPWLTYPYGLSSAAVERAAAEEGYKGALRVAGGWMNPAGTPAPFALPRYNVPAGLSTRGFTLRTAGLLAG
ncbi:MAG: polysaccharide deacetylase family protein [Gemmatimonadota bacterium]|jgi:peptidoglycan/xylan/chitin deacetylase (PgdA/CDA1 family)|nr:polysaccharide deacetylase family protein [Gemmatimonadota bacterium]